MRDVATTRDPRRIGHVIGPPTSSSSPWRRHPQLMTDPHRRHPLRPTCRQPAADELVRLGAPDAQHPRRLLHRQEVRRDRARRIPLGHHTHPLHASREAACVTVFTPTDTHRPEPVKNSAPEHDVRLNADCHALSRTVPRADHDLMARRRAASRAPDLSRHQLPPTDTGWQATDATAPVDSSMSGLTGGLARVADEPESPARSATSWDEAPAVARRLRRQPYPGVMWALWRW